MICPHQLLSGYELNDPTGGQQRLGLWNCSLDNSYMRKYCGTCNHMCQVVENDRYGPFDTITPLRSDLNSILAATNGLELTNTVYTVQAKTLPPLVPLVNRIRRSIPDESEVYAVSPSVLFRLPKYGNHSNVHRVFDVRKYLHLDPQTPLLLTGNATDSVLEWWWENPQLAMDVIDANHFDYALSPNYSVYGNRCPLEWAVNMKRSMMLMDDLKNVAANAIPTLATPNAFFRNRVASWLAANPTVSSIAFNMQMMKSNVEFQRQLGFLVELQNAVGRSLHFVITGPTKSTRVDMVRSLLDSVSIVSTYHLNRRYQSA